MKNKLKPHLMAIAFGLVAVFSACKKDSTDDPLLGQEKKSKVFVADEEGATISVIDVASNEKVATVTLTDEMGRMMMPHNVQVAPDGNTVWATGVPMTEGEDEFVFVINPLTNDIIKKIDVGKELHLAHVVLDKDSKYAFVTANEGNLIIQFNAKEFTEVKRIDVGAGRKPHGLRYQGGKLYVANMDGKSMSVVDVNTGAINEIPLGGVAVQTAVTSDGMFAFASLYDTKEVFDMILIQEKLSEFRYRLNHKDQYNYIQRHLIDCSMYATWEVYKVAQPQIKYMLST